MAYGMLLWEIRVCYDAQCDMIDSLPCINNDIFGCEVFLPASLLLLPYRCLYSDIWKQSSAANSSIAQTKTYVHSRTSDLISYCTSPWPSAILRSHVHVGGVTQRLLMPNLGLTMRLSWLGSQEQRAAMITGLASLWPGPEPRPESGMGHPHGDCWEKHIEVLLCVLTLISIGVGGEMILNIVSKFNVEKVKLLGSNARAWRSRTSAATRDVCRRI